MQRVSSGQPAHERCCPRHAGSESAEWVGHLPRDARACGTHAGGDRRGLDRLAPLPPRRETLMRETVTTFALEARRTELATLLTGLEQKIRVGQQQLAADVEQHRLAPGGLPGVERLLRLTNGAGPPPPAEAPGG